MLKRTAVPTLTSLALEPRWELISLSFQELTRPTIREYNSGLDYFS